MKKVFFGPVYEKGRYWVSPSRKGGYDIFRSDGVASLRCAQCNIEEGALNWCKREIDRRIAADEAKAKP